MRLLFPGKQQLDRPISVFWTVGFFWHFAFWSFREFVIAGWGNADVGMSV
jgi:hypothetical protein